jgi:hypothetical protein
VVTTVAAAAMPMPVNIVARKQPVNGTFQIGLGAAASLDQCDAHGGVRSEDVTQSVAAVATELKDRVSDIGDNTSSGTHLHDICIHLPIIATAKLMTPSQGIVGLAHLARHGPAGHRT